MCQKACLLFRLLRRRGVYFMTRVRICKLCKRYYTR